MKKFNKAIKKSIGSNSNSYLERGKANRILKTIKSSSSNS
jgi:hypothetical protein